MNRTHEYKCFFCSMNALHWWVHPVVQNAHIRNFSRLPITAAGSHKSQFDTNQDSDCWRGTINISFISWKMLLLRLKLKWQILLRVLEWGHQASCRAVVHRFIAAPVWWLKFRWSAPHSPSVAPEKIVQNLDSLFLYFIKCNCTSNWKGLRRVTYFLYLYTYYEHFHSALLHCKCELDIVQLCKTQIVMRFRERWSNS